MKLELKENMYIRNCYGRIAKIEYIEDNTAYCDNWLYHSYEDYITFINLNDEEDINEITKASYNIIDLIEAGDYVNGYKIEKVNNNLNEHKGTCNSLDTYLWIVNDLGEFEEIVIFENDIKSVITHEQMEQISYKIKE